MPVRRRHVRVREVVGFGRTREPGGKHMRRSTQELTALAGKALELYGTSWVTMFILFKSKRLECPN